jgi:hypothetical protein
MCDRCEHPIHPDPFYKHKTVPAMLVLPWADRPLAALGVRSPAWVIVHDGERAAFLRASPVEPASRSDRKEVPDGAS